MRGASSARSRGRLERTLLPVLVAFTAALLLGGACNASRKPASLPPERPTLRLYVLTSVAGALEPCGCRKDMLGGVDHAAALIASSRQQADATLVVGAGPMLFMDPHLDAKRGTQDLWKAEALGRALGELGLVAWAPGANDWAAGERELSRLVSASGAHLLAANVTSKSQAAGATQVVEVGRRRVGLAGVTALNPGGVAPSGASRSSSAGGEPDAVRTGDPVQALERAHAELEARGVTLFIALIAAERGDALRMLEAAPGWHVAVLGKPQERGEGNDGPSPPTLVGSTLVVQTPNHLQSLAVVDLHLSGDDLALQDGVGLAGVERRASLESRIGELERRLKEWDGAATIAREDVAARRQDLARLREELAALKPPALPKSGSFFRYRLQQVRETAGVQPAVARRIDEYYRRVNEHNAKAFASLEPEPVGKGQSGYLGDEACGNCHEEEHAFWQRTRHAKAYGVLVEQHKEFNLDCVACHVTGYGKPGGSTVTHVGALANVQCEVCHGPGSRHEDSPKDASLIVAKPSESLCAERCHHPPHVADEWSAQAAWKKIVGPGHRKEPVAGAGP